MMIVTREHLGHAIYGPSVYGFWEAYIGGRFWKADSLSGIKVVIAEKSGLLDSWVYRCGIDEGTMLADMYGRDPGGLETFDIIVERGLVTVPERFEKDRDVYLDGIHHGWDSLIEDFMDYEEEN